MKGKIANLFHTGGRWALVGLLTLLLVVGPLTGLAYADSAYKVQSGDSLISIAARHGTTVEAIVVANSLSSRTIYIGQVLTIPSPGSSPAPAQVQPGNGAYTVQPGDTLSEIAVRFGTTTEALQLANGLSSTSIYAGQVLRVASGSSTAPLPVPNTQQQAAPGTYRVQSGDNLSTLAQRFGVTREALAAANGISASSLLYIGQALRIPGTGQPPAPPTPRPTSPPPPQATATSAPAPPVVAQPTTTPQPVVAPAQADPAKPVKYTVQPGDNLSTIAVRFNTTVASLKDLNNLQDGNFLRVGQELTIVKGSVQNNDPPPVPSATIEPLPPMGEFGPKWIDVNLTTQTMTALEGQTPVFTSKMSGGTERNPTVEGTYRIYAKYKSQNMKGGEGADYYYLPNVPWVMYFYSGYALHGTYWHNSFGQPMSRGCVNLPPDAAKWMYEWAPIGVMVVSHK